MFPCVNRKIPWGLTDQVQRRTKVHIRANRIDSGNNLNATLVWLAQAVKFNANGQVMSQVPTSHRQNPHAWTRKLRNKPLTEAIVKMDLSTKPLPR